jgi:hypothetical protein
MIRSFTSKQDSTQMADSLSRAARRKVREDSLAATGLAADSVQKLLRIPEPPIAADFEAGFRPTSPPRAPNRQGVNTFQWDMRFPAPYAFRGMILWAAGAQGVMAPPGTYQVRVAVNGKIVGTQRFKLLGDPRVKGVTPARYAEQFKFLQRVATKFGQANEAVSTIRYVRGEVDDRKGKLSGESKDSFDQHANALLPEIGSVEDSVYQTKSRSGQDPLNYPIRLNNKIGAIIGVAGSSDGKPTAQTYQVFDLLSLQLDRELARMRVVMTAHIAPMNGILKQAGLPEIVVNRNRLVP